MRQTTIDLRYPLTLYVRKDSLDEKPDKLAIEIAPN